MKYFVLEYEEKNEHKFMVDLSTQYNSSLNVSEIITLLRINENNFEYVN